MFVKKYVVLFINLFLLLLISSESLATAWPKTRAEFASLPPYCLARQGKQIGLTVSEVEIKKWERILGGGFLHVHHFCAALNTLKVLVVLIRKVISSGSNPGAGIAAKCITPSAPFSAS